MPQMVSNSDGNQVREQSSKGLPYKGRMSLYNTGYGSEVRQRISVPDQAVILLLVTG